MAAFVLPFSSVRKIGFSHYLGCQVRAVDILDEVVVTVAGAVDEPGTNDGSFQLARFVGVEGMTMDPARRVMYLVDALPVNM